MRPHRQQPTILLSPRDSLGKNTRLGRHFLLQVIIITYTLLVVITLRFLVQCQMVIETVCTLTYHVTLLICSNLMGESGILFTFLEL